MAVAPGLTTCRPSDFGPGNAAAVGPDDGADLHTGPAWPGAQPDGWLRARIEAGEFPPDVPLPSEKTLVDLFGVARDTPRRAVQALRDEGLVRTVPQRGTYVIPKPGKHPKP
jgi:regulatory GntR family protein